MYSVSVGAGIAVLGFAAVIATFVYSFGLIFLERARDATAIGTDAAAVAVRKHYDDTICLFKNCARDSIWFVLVILLAAVFIATVIIVVG
jgi:hypothetical protein